MKFQVKNWEKDSIINLYNLLNEQEEPYFFYRQELKKFQKLVDDGCLPSNIVNTSEVYSTNKVDVKNPGSPYPPGTKFYIVVKGKKSGKKVHIFNDGSFMYEDRTKFGKLSCKEAQNNPNKVSQAEKQMQIVTGQTQSSNLYDLTSKTKSDSGMLKKSDGEPIDYKGTIGTIVTNANKIEPKSTEETGQSIFDKYHMNYEKRIKPFINVDRKRIVFKGKKDSDINDTIKKKLNDYIENTYAMALEDIVPIGGDDVKYVWTKNKYKEKYQR